MFLPCHRQTITCIEEVIVLLFIANLCVSLFLRWEEDFKCPEKYDKLFQVSVIVHVGASACYDGVLVVIQVREELA